MWKNKSKPALPSSMVDKFWSDCSDMVFWRVYTNVDRNLLYGIIACWTHGGKFVEVNDKLWKKLLKKDKKHSSPITDLQIIKTNKIVSEILENSPVSMSPICYVKDWSQSLCISELGAYTDPEYTITDITVIVSKKDPSRILWIAYLANNNWVIFHRYFMRYSTLTKHTKSAIYVLKKIQECIMRSI
jgi:hypothetical protein